MTAEKVESTTHIPLEGHVVKYLQEKKDGATFAQIIQHLSANCGKSSDDLSGKVKYILDNCTALGFLERKGSSYKNWKAKELCAREGRSQSYCTRRRRRRIPRRHRQCPHR